MSEGVGPRCPECGVRGVEYIDSQESEAKSEAGATWFEVAFCEECGHVYGVFAKNVLAYTML